MRTAREAAGKSGALAELEQALRTYSDQVPEEQRSHAESVEIRAVAGWVRLAKHRVGLQQELTTAAPPDAQVEVGIVGDEIVASVGLAGEALRRDAKDGWHLRDGALEFAGALPWSELSKQVLAGDTGIAATALRTSLVIDMVVPPASIGTRFYVVEFRGIAVVLTFAADDTVHAALVDGDVRRDERDVRTAFVRAISGVLGANRVVAVPGAVHRLTFEVTASSSRERAAVRVLFEGVELFPTVKARRLNPQQEPTFAIHARQEITIPRVVVRAEGL